MEVFFDEVKGMWRAQLSYEVTTWGDTEEDARVELNRCLERFVKEIKEENREAYVKKR